MSASGDRTGEADARAVTARGFWTVEVGRGELREEALRATNADEVRVRALFSGISRGTERLVFTGRVPESEWARMACPLQGGALPFPVKYGYCAVGVIEGGPRDGERVFVLHPHQDRFVAPAAMAVPLPSGLPAARAVLAANMETALNICWDAAPLAGERALVIGAGVVGLLTARLLARIPGCEVTLCDLDATRAPLAEAFGARFALPENAPGGAELIVHATANPAGLALALERAAFEARILEASWYGEALCPLPLGAAFHVNRLRLISTQVGHVGGAMRGRRSLRNRMETALALLADDALDALLGAPVDFADLPREMPRLLGLEAGSGAPCPLIRYD
jgi:threonine dehydrogenase-like Zn-dependent dehydrogenase